MHFSRFFALLSICVAFIVVLPTESWAKAQKVTVVKALYASKASTKESDATSAIADLCAKAGPVCEFTCAQIVLNVSDPEKGMPKECRVEFSCSGKKTKEQTIGDGQVGKLSCK